MPMMNTTASRKINEEEKSNNDKKENKFIVLMLKRFSFILFVFALPFFCVDLKIDGKKKDELK